MKPIRAASLLLLLALTACADGGSRGSGIFAEVNGNVASVQTESSAAGVQNLHVAIEGSTFDGVTDADGHFSVRGDFAGMVNLVFQSSDTDRAAKIRLNVPGAATLTLNDVSVDFDEGQASAVTQNVDFEGIIAEPNCDTLELTMVSAQGDPYGRYKYTVQLDSSSLQDSHGNSLSCESLNGKERATVEGNVNADGTFGDAVIEILGD